MAINRRGTLGRTLRIALVSVFAVAAFAFAATAAGAAVKLEWTQKKVYEAQPVPPPPQVVNRTWLGYLTRTGNPGVPDGTVSPAGVATGPTVNGLSDVSTDYTWTFPAASGTPDSFALNGTTEFEGTLNMVGPNHGINISLQDPVITLAGDGTGTLTFSGTDSTAAPFTGPLFTLDLSEVTITPGEAGAYTIGNIIPAIASTQAFGAAYPIGSGPDRLPNTFGSFSITVTPPVQPVPPVYVETPGPTIEKTVEIPPKFTKLTVKKPPFGKKAKKLVARVTKGKKFIGYAEITGRKITFIGIETKLKGKYRFSEVGGKRKVTIKF